MAIPFTAALYVTRGAHEQPSSAADLFDASRGPDRLLAYFARASFDRVVTRALRSNNELAALALERSLHDLHPDDRQLTLDTIATATLARDFDGAATLIDGFLGASDPSLSTRTLAQRGVAQLARAWVAFARGDAAAARTAVDAAALLPRPRLVQEEALEVVELRAAMVRAFFERAGSGERAGGQLDAVFAAAPVDQERCAANEAWFGEFGPLFGLEVLRRCGRSREWIEGATAVVAAIEASHDRHGHGLLARGEQDAREDSGDAPPRPAAWPFLSLAEAWLTDGGDPARARSVVEPRIAAVLATPGELERELLVEAQLLLARIALHQGDRETARSASAGALEVAQALNSAVAREFLVRESRDEAPLLPHSHLFRRADNLFANLATRARVVRGSVRLLADRDALGAAEELFAAGAHWPWDSDRWLRHATDFARRGRSSEARRCLERVDDSIEHAYDRACAHALLGEAALALDLLALHLSRPGRTPEGRALDLAWCRNDPDLSSLRADPRFPRE